MALALQLLMIVAKSSAITNYHPPTAKNTISINKKTKAIEENR